MTGMSADDRHTDKNGNEYEEGSLENELKAVERVFGTTANPTAGKYYLVKSADVSNIVENDIFKQVMQKVQNPIHTVKVVDYFPQDILDNFEITIVNPSIGSVLNEIKKETKTIEWDIGTLKGNEIATVANKILPNTGRNIVIIGILLVTVILVAIGIIKNYKYREVK